MKSKADDAFKTISEVALEIGVPKHVLRFWETRFPQVKPMKRGGGRRYYRPEDLVLLNGIRQLLHSDGYTIKGVQKILREQGVESVKDAAHAKQSKRAAREKQQAVNVAKVGAQRKQSAARAPCENPASHLARTARAPCASIDEAIGELEACRSLLTDLRPRPRKKHVQGAARPLASKSRRAASST